MPLLAETPTAEIPRIVCDILAADAGLSGFFERIAVADAPQFEQPLVTPSLLVYPGVPLMQRQVGGEVALLYDVAVLIVLPRLTPAIPGLSIPTTPAVASGGAGTQTGTFEYRLTEVSDDGESYASEARSIALASNVASITIPAVAAGHGFRVWRSAAEKTSCRWAGTAWAAGAWLDSGYPDAGEELAPVLLMPERITDGVVSVLMTGEWLLDGGAIHADSAIAVRAESGSVVAGRNVYVRQITATIPSYYDPKTNTFLVAGAG